MIAQDLSLRNIGDTLELDVEHGKVRARLRGITASSEETVFRPVASAVSLRSHLSIDFIELTFDSFQLTVEANTPVSVVTPAS